MHTVPVFLTLYTACSHEFAYDTQYLFLSLSREFKMYSITQRRFLTVHCLFLCHAEEEGPLDAGTSLEC